MSSTDTQPAIVGIRWSDGLPEIQTARLTLRLAKGSEVDKIVRFLSRNRKHTERWEPSRPSSFFSESEWIGVPERHQAEARRGEGYRFRALWQGDETDFIAHGMLRDVLRGDCYTCQLGYTVDVRCIGNGIATEMGRALVQFAFDNLDLHRIEACHMPANAASARVLAKLGFSNEGLMRQSLRVNGQWEDHVLVALVNPNFRGGRPRLG